MMVDLNAIVGGVMEYGLIGIVAVCLGWLAWDRDKKLQAEKDARLADSKETTKALEQSTAVLEGVLEAVKGLADSRSGGK